MTMKRMIAMLLMLALLCAGIGVAETGNEQEAEAMKMWIGETAVAVAWEDNDAVRALRELVAEQPLTIEMSMYGGFEQVGSIGTELPRNDGQRKEGFSHALRLRSFALPPVPAMSVSRLS